jgi:hypothetical protein
MITDTKIMELTHFYRHLVPEPRDFDQDPERIISAIGDGLPPDHPTLAITEINAWWLTEKVDPDFRLGDAPILPVCTMR